MTDVADSWLLTHFSRLGRVFAHFSHAYHESVGSPRPQPVA